MDLRGQRFNIDFSDDEGENEGASATTIPAKAVPSISSAFIGDIKEREVKPPAAPKLKTTPNGFPEHKKRSRLSAFKQQRAAAANKDVAESVNAFGISSQAPNTASSEGRNGNDMTEREKIDLENKQRIAAMSPEEIAEEQRELLASLDPSLIERFLRRANLDDGRGDTGIDPPSPRNENKVPPAVQSETIIENEPVEEKVPGVAAPQPRGKRVTASKTVQFEDDDGDKGPTTPINLQPASQAQSIDPSDLPEGSVHFPQAPAAPELDPNDPSFLENLHSKYFPNLPSDPTKLAWMAPVPTPGSIADQESPYYPGQDTLLPSALRFDFRGGILPPRIARAVPTSKGLHHHGEAPESAGYTVPELARLARSAFPAQRCIAFQTLGRLLYRLGRGEWGDEASDVANGLWKCVADGGVIETLEEAAGAEGGHQGSKVYAIEAVWLWQKGGGKKWKAS